MDLVGDEAPKGATFEEFWSVYPRKVGKGAAKKSWDRATKGLKASPDDIMAGARRYAALKRGAEIQYVAHPGTWLNQQRWLDEDAGPSTDDSPSYTPNAEAIEIRSRTLIALDNKKRLLLRTRESVWDSVREAARRLECKPSELWDCLLPGHDGLESKAWKAVTTQEDIPDHLSITRDMWLSGRDRMESRKRAISIKRLTAA